MILKEELKKKFGYTSFRLGQEEVVRSLLDGRDVLALLPTATGKSLCYQLPAFLTSGVTIIVSPLLSLMEDQVQQLKSTGMKRVVALNSFMSWKEREWTLENLWQYKLIYTSPEMLQSSAVQQKLSRLQIAYFVVDEAHCISEWGHDFRTDYLRLVEVKKKLGSPPTLAITATATKTVQHDIIRLLEMNQVEKVIYSVDRANIALSVEKFKTNQERLQALLKSVQQLEGPGIVYFASRRWTEEAATLLTNEGIARVSCYHGGMANEDRLLIQQQFMNNQLSVICCTSAFGMGINKKNIRYVIHFHHPLQLESYVQEIGRAGRDGKPSLALLMYCVEDGALARRLLERERVTEEQLQCILESLSTYQSLTQEEERLLQEQCQCSETVWQAIRYQLELRGLLEPGNKVGSFSPDALRLELNKGFEQRRQVKQKNLHRFERWIQAQSCRRKLLLQYFSERTGQAASEPCCDQCGIELELFKRTSGDSGDLFQSWQEELAKRLGRIRRHV